MSEIITSKVAIGISACLYNCPVRYNGKSFDALKLIGRERADFSWTPVCPECMAGLGVPRDPIHLTGTGQEVLAGTAHVRNRRGHDATQRVVDGARDAMRVIERAGVEAFVAKESSPTCGLYKARVGKKRTETGGGSGVFGAMLLEAPLFVIPDSAFSNALMWWDWRRRLHAWLWLKRQPVQTSRDLYAAWHVVKFIAQETNRPGADEIGRALAALPKKPSPTQLADLQARMLHALTVPSTRSRIRGALMKAYSHAAKSGQLAGIERYDLSDVPSIDRPNIDDLVRDLTAMERISFENDLLFGTTPVLRREGRRVKARDEARAGGATA